MGRHMARHMAQHLQKGGHQLGVWARRAESAAPLVAIGATCHDTPAALAAVSDVVFTMVTASSDFEQVVLGASGIFQGAKPDLVLVDMKRSTTIRNEDQLSKAAQWLGMIHYLVKYFFDAVFHFVLL